MAFLVRDARAEAAAASSAGDVLRALEIWDLILATHATDHEARARIAELLARAGAREPALAVFRTVAEHDMRSGHPLAALVCLKALAALGADLSFEEGIAQLAEMYAAGSPALGRVAARQASVNLDAPMAPLPAAAASRTPTDATALADRAARRAVDFKGLPPPPREVFPIPFLSDLDRDVFVALARAIPVRRRYAGDYVVRAGDPGHAFFLVATGELGVVGRGAGAEAVELARLHEGALFGEMALLTNQPRSATVVAAGEADVLEVSHDILGAVTRRMPAAASALERFARDRLLRNLLATSPLFKPFSAAQRQDLIRHFEGSEVAPGTDVILQGEPGEGLFVVLSGEVEVLKSAIGDATAPGAEVSLAKLGVGEMFGEMSLLHGGNTTATVRTIRPSTLLFLHRTYFERLVEAVPDLKRTFEELAARRSNATRVALSGESPALTGDEDIIIDDEEILGV